MEQQRDGTLGIESRRALNKALAPQNTNFQRLSKEASLKPAEQAWLKEMKDGNGPRAAALAAQEAGAWGNKPLTPDEKVELKTLRAGLGQEAADYAKKFRNAEENPAKYPLSPAERARGEALLAGKTRREADAAASAAATATIRGEAVAHSNPAAPERPAKEQAAPGAKSVPWQFR